MYISELRKYHARHPTCPISLRISKKFSIYLSHSSG